MIGWLINAAYVAVWLLYGRRLTVTLLDAQVRHDLCAYPRIRAEENGGASRAARDWLGMYLVAGFGLAAFWPVVAPVRGALRLARGSGLFRTPTEIEHAQRAELERLRRLAREHGLTMPDVEP